VNEVALRGALEFIVGKEMWLFLVITPLLLFPNPLTVVALPLIPAMWLARWRLKGYLTVRTPFDGPILGLLLMVPVSLYASADLNRSLPKLCGIILGIAIFYGLANNLRTARAVWLTTAILVLAGVIASLLGLVGTRWFYEKLFSFSVIYRLLPQFAINLPGTIEGRFHPNEVGGTLTLFLPLTVSLLGAVVQLRKSEPDRTAAAETKDDKSTPSGAPDRLLSSPKVLIIALVLAALLSGCTLLLTQSRGSYVGVAVSLVFLAMLYNRRFWLIIPGAALALFAAAQIWGLERMLNWVLILEATGQARGRAEIWRWGLCMIRDCPFTGIGLNTFWEVGKECYSFFTASRVFFPHAHNIFLQVAVDLGLPGLMAYLALVLSFGLIAWRTYRRLADRMLRALVAGLAAGFLAHHVYGLTDAITLGAKPGLAFWAFIGLVAALHGQVMEQSGK
jgi:putative inorganic carbon (HCO3(-)) transporter